MIRSGEWFGEQALNAMRHRMGSRDAIDTVAVRRSSQQGTSMPAPQPILQPNVDSAHYVCFDKG